MVAFWAILLTRGATEGHGGCGIGQYCNKRPKKSFVASGGNIAKICVGLMTHIQYITSFIFDSELNLEVSPH